MEADPNTLPMPLSIVSVDAAPPLKVQAKVVDWPAVIVVGVAVKVEIIGAAGFTVTTTCLVAVPLELDAVKV